MKKFTYHFCTSWQSVPSAINYYDGVAEIGYAVCPDKYAEFKKFLKPDIDCLIILSLSLLEVDNREEVEEHLLDLAAGKGSTELRQENLPRAATRSDIQWLKKAGYITSQSIPRHYDGSIVKYEITPKGIARLNQLNGTIK